MNNSASTSSQHGVAQQLLILGGGFGGRFTWANCRALKRNSGVALDWTLDLAFAKDIVHFHAGAPCKSQPDCNTQSGAHSLTFRASDRLPVPVSSRASFGRGLTSKLHDRKTI
jgi:hypothetical protein